MAMASKGMMCQVMAASFCESVNSCAGFVVDERNSSLGVDQIDKMTVLSMNMEFMEFMRREYPEVVTKGTSHGKYGTVVTMAHAKEDRVGGEGIDDQPNELTWVECHSTSSGRHLHVHLSFTNKACHASFTFTFTFTFTFQHL